MWNKAELSCSEVSTMHNGDELVLAATWPHLPSACQASKP